MLARMGRGGRGGPGGGAGDGPKNAKGSVKFWLKDGQLAKMELKTSATMNFQREDRAMASTRTVEIKDVGTSTVEVPADAKKKLEQP